MNELDTLRAERDAARADIAAFLKKFDEIKPHLDGVFEFYAIHGMKWPPGLNWRAELEKPREWGYCSHYPEARKGERRKDWAWLSPDGWCTGTGATWYRNRRSRSDRRKG